MHRETFDQCVKIFFDLETTGFYRTNKPWTGYPDEIVQICAICEKKTFLRYCKPSVKDNWRGLRPGKKRKSAYDVHKIGPEKVKKAETWREVGADLVAFVHEASKNAPGIILVAYNGLAFDAPFLKAVNQMHEVRGFERPVYVCDPLKIARDIFTSGRKKQSDVFFALFNRVYENAHDARVDVEALAQICKHPAFERKLHSVCVRFESLEVKKKEEILEVKKVETKKSALVCAACKRVYSVYFKHECLAS